jgi:hydrogenase nickel incorporation protein HypA/HybF
MHEQSIVESFLALVLENAEKAKANKVLRIYLVIGDLSGVIEEAVDFYFGFLRKGTIAENASIFYMHTSAQVRCRNCDTVYNPEKLDFHCPNCREQKIDIIGGRELYIESMEVE